eukprot:2173766-Rhodomonas_salina.3
MRLRPGLDAPAAIGPTGSGWDGSVQASDLVKAAGGRSCPSGEATAMATTHTDDIESCDSWGLRHGAQSTMFSQRCLVHAHEQAELLDSLSIRHRSATHLASRFRLALGASALPRQATWSPCHALLHPRAPACALFQLALCFPASRRCWVRYLYPEFRHLCSGPRRPPAAPRRSSGLHAPKRSFRRQERAEAAGRDGASGRCVRCLCLHPDRPRPGNTQPRPPRRKKQDFLTTRRLEGEVFWAWRASETGTQEDRGDVSARWKAGLGGCARWRASAGAGAWPAKQVEIACAGWCGSCLAYQAGWARRGRGKMSPWTRILGLEGGCAGAGGENGWATSRLAERGRRRVEARSCWLRGERPRRRPGVGLGRSERRRARLRRSGSGCFLAPWRRHRHCHHWQSECSRPPRQRAALTRRRHSQQAFTQHTLETGKLLSRRGFQLVCSRRLAGGGGLHRGGLAPAAMDQDLVRRRRRGVQGGDGRVHAERGRGEHELGQSRAVARRRGAQHKRRGGPP